jgi:DNA-binding transcriptional MerR regulator
MPLTINGQTYYRTAEVFRRLGVSRNTLYRWLQKDTLSSSEHRDSRGWRLFTQDDIDRLENTINRITKIERQLPKITNQAPKQAHDNICLFRHD